MFEIVISIIIVILTYIYLYKRFEKMDELKNIDEIRKSLDFKILLLNLKFISVKIIKFGGNNYTIYKYVGKNSFENEILKISVCSKCGDYVESVNSMEEKIYCKCENIFFNKLKWIHREKFIKVLDQLIYTMYSDSDSEEDMVDFSLKPSPYSHGGECVPDFRTCHRCWRYWCISCNGGLGGMYSCCSYKKCRVGRKNIGREH
jgi:hypothetical protein